MVFVLVVVCFCLGGGSLFAAPMGQAGRFGGEGPMPGKAFLHLLALMDRLEITDHQFSALRMTFRYFRQDMHRIDVAQGKHREQLQHFLMGNDDARVALELTVKMGKLAERRTAAIIKAVGEARRILTPEQWRKIRKLVRLMKAGKPGKPGKSGKPGRLGKPEMPGMQEMHRMHGMHGMPGMQGMHGIPEKTGGRERPGMGEPCGPEMHQQQMMMNAPEGPFCAPPFMGGEPMDQRIPPPPPPQP
jgi:Spy/CpxP family protein refolding chaperone